MHYTNREQEPIADVCSVMRGAGRTPPSTGDLDTSPADSFSGVPWPRAQPPARIAAWPSGVFRARIDSCGRPRGLSPSSADYAAVANCKHPWLPIQLRKSSSRGSQFAVLAPSAICQHGDLLASGEA